MNKFVLESATSLAFSRQKEAKLAGKKNVRAVFSNGVIEFAVMGKDLSDCEKRFNRIFNGVTISLK